MHVCICVNTCVNLYVCMSLYTYIHIIHMHRCNNTCGIRVIKYYIHMYLDVVIVISLCCLYLYLYVYVHASCVCVDGYTSASTYLDMYIQYTCISAYTYILIFSYICTFSLHTCRCMFFAPFLVSEEIHIYLIHVCILIFTNGSMNICIWVVVKIMIPFGVP